MKKQIMVLCMLLPVIKASAQDEKEVFISNYSYSPVQQHGNVQRVVTNLFFPLAHSDRFMLGGGVGYRGHYFNNLPEGFGPSLHSISVQVGGNWRLDEKHTITGGASMALNSDMKAVSGDALVYSMLVGYKVQYSDQFRLGYGLGFGHLMFGDQIIPLLDFEYRPAPAWTLYGKFPLTTRVAYQFAKRSQVSLGTLVQPNSFRTSEQDQFVRMFQVESIASYEFKLTPQWRLRLDAAYNLVQKYELYDNDYPRKLGVIGVPLGKDAPVPLAEVSTRGMEWKIGLRYVL